MASLDISNVSFKLIEAVDKQILAEHDQEVWKMALQSAVDHLYKGGTIEEILKLELPTTTPNFLNPASY